MAITPGLVNASAELEGCLCEMGQPRLASADRSRLEIQTQPTTQLDGTPDSESILEFLSVLAPTTQETPEPDPHVVEDDPELLDPLYWGTTQRQANLDHSEHRTQRGHLLRQAHLCHLSSHMLDDRLVRRTRRKAAFPCVFLGAAKPPSDCNGRGLLIQDGRNRLTSTGSCYRRLLSIGVD
jgi:hypothetical protein